MSEIRKFALIGGADEAGRGCLAGPMVVAGVSATRSGIRDLKKLGVKDSKMLTRRQRETLYTEILKTCSRAYWALIEPAEIDKAVLTGTKYRKLNYLEAVYFAKVIDQLEARSVTVDACDTVPKRFQDNVHSNMKSRCRVTALHKADRDFPIVSAASILAKVERDRQVERLRRLHGDFGSGYPSDPKTKIYFRKLLEEGRFPPDWTRRSWKSWERFRNGLLPKPDMPAAEARTSPQVAV